MNTYETMKHNIPEGATHYIDGDFYFFAWVNLSEGKYYNEGEWLNYEFSTLPDGVVKPIPVEAPKEEAKTYRYEKVTDSIFDPKEEFERGELFEMVGVEIYRPVEREIYLDDSFFHETLYRRIEVTERELELEAAKDIYDTYMQNWNNSYIDWEDLNDKHKESLIDIVRKTGYRKDFNDVNGKG